MPFISVVGGMATSSISGNPDTVVPSTIGGMAMQMVLSVLGGYSALESPFGGVIAICGHISNPPDEPIPSAKLRYKVQFRKKGTTNWQTITNNFKIWIITWNGVFWSMDSKTQVATGGYYTYEEDLTPPTQDFVEGNVLAQLYTPLPDGDGEYEIRVLLYKVGAPPEIGVPLNHVSSNVVKVMIDNTCPDASVFLDAGACTKFTVGDIITGYFTASDKHIDHYSLVVEPVVAVAPTIDPSGESYPLMSAPGHTNKSFELTTTESTTPCGYVLHLHVWDRTIKSNSRPRNYRGATVGLCLLEET